VLLAVLVLAAAAAAAAATASSSADEPSKCSSSLESTPLLPSHFDPEKALGPARVALFLVRFFPERAHTLARQAHTVKESGIKLEMRRKTSDKKHSWLGLVAKFFFLSFFNLDLLPFHKKRQPRRNRRRSRAPGPGLLHFVPSGSAGRADVLSVQGKKEKGSGMH
jgi:hypothetical protein